MALTCPRCGFEAVEGADCPRCGVDVARYRAEMTVKAPVAPRESSGRDPRAIGEPVQISQRTNGLAVASMVLGIVWVFWLGSLLAVIFGHVSLGQIRRSNGREAGRGLAIAGVTLGWIGLGVWILWFFSVLLALVLRRH